MTEPDLAHTDFPHAVAALREGRLDEAIAQLEALADRGIEGSSVAFDRGIAYAERARSGRGMPGDLGQAAAAFEEALRRDPHDGEARRALEEIRREIARRDARGKAEELGAPSMGRAIVVSLPGDAWGALAIGGSILLAGVLAVRARVPRALRVWSSTIAVLALLITIVGSVAGLAARSLRHHLREAVVVAPHVTAAPEGGQAFDLEEGARVDVLEERAGSARVRNDRGEGWTARDSLRMLPPYRP